MIFADVINISAVENGEMDGCTQLPSSAPLSFSEESWMCGGLRRVRLFVLPDSDQFAAELEYCVANHPCGNGLKVIGLR